MIDRNEPATGLIVGVDGNPATLRAVDWAAREADRRHLALDLVQVLPPSERGPVLREPTGRAHALLEQGRRIAADVAPDVAVRASVLDGVVGPALVGVAERAALLVMGSRHAEGDLDLTVGRTVAQTVGHAPCPVVVVPQRWDSGTGPHRRGPGRGRRIHRVHRGGGVRRGRRRPVAGAAGGRGGGAALR